MALLMSGDADGDYELAEGLGIAGVGVGEACDGDELDFVLAQASLDVGKTYLLAGCDRAAVEGGCISRAYGLASGSGSDIYESFRLFPQ